MCKFINVRKIKALQKRGYMSRQISVERLRNRIDKNDKEIKNIREKIKKKQKRPQIKNGQHSYDLRKARRNPNFNNKTVLTDATSEYVLTYLQGKKASEETIFYWQQSINFYDATKLLDIFSAPLTTYYCFLNATKALLTYKGICFDFKHGVSGSQENGRIVLQNENVFFHPSGVLAGLGEYYKEKPQTKEKYNLKDLLYNLPYIHRAYTMMYPNKPELFIPIYNPRFVYDSDRDKKNGWFEAELEEEYSDAKTLKKLEGYSVDQYYSNMNHYVIRRNKQFDWQCSRNKPNEKSIKSFEEYYQKIRKDVDYIYSPNELWYLKRRDLNNSSIIDKNTLVITMGAMHRLSELARYSPLVLKSHLEKEQGWLLREFINKSIVQFIDAIASEITGDDFRQTGFRN